MRAPRPVVIVWSVVGALLLGLTVLLYGPMRIAWHCYQLHEHAPREQGQVVAKLENATFALLLEDGPHAGQSCTADTSWAIYEDTEMGDVLEVVYVEWKPGTCELVSTIEASAEMIWAIFATTAAIVAILLGIGAFLTRSFTRPDGPARHMTVEAREVRCPACGKPMDEGYVPLVAGIHWRRIGDPIGLPHALGGMPGTVGRRGRPRLHAFRCVPCEILTLQVGDPARR